MSVVSLLGVEVKNNPAQFDAPYEFEITFECLEQLQKGEFNWRGHATTILTAAHRPRVEADLRGLRDLVSTVKPGRDSPPADTPQQRV